MILREISLPEGWYPRDSAACARFLSGFAGYRGRARAVIAPHAGWYYSGHIAAKAISSLDADAQTIVIVGGHLPAGYPPIFAMEEAAQTPLGHMPIDTELRELLMREIDGQEDIYQDNTVEVLVPIARFFFPEASLVWMRLPAEMPSFEAGKIIARAARKLKRTVCLAASTDLTHYGPNYGFTPAGKGKKALAWVTEVNDARFIRAVLSADPKQVLETAAKDFSCCSPGAVLGALGFTAGLNKPCLLEYSTSAAREPEIPDSFVGYAALSLS
ncbi:MAG TPA: AmmeMemoRadiSam system protein B [Treponema sp.]|nr:AmmeMemoRadiSam system protein B [Treponema sp.]